MRSKIAQNARRRNVFLFSFNESIFEKKRPSLWPYWLLLLLFGVGYGYFSQDNSAKVISQNQIKAQLHIREILEALRKWQSNDYDANGRADYPLAELNKLVQTRFINGERLELIRAELANADFRNSKPEPLDGYYFTLTHWEKTWPSTAMVSECQILAVPAELGKSGSCSFYVNTAGQAYYCNFKLKDRVPSWPDQRQLDAGVWKAFSWK